MYLNHPNIVKLYGFFHDQENVYLIMEYCSGSHLFKMIRQKKQFE
jgi:serine/threonine protein kinase